MAIKKSEIYSQIWAACDKLRGGVEPARYKDYILTGADHKRRKKVEGECGASEAYHQLSQNERRLCRTP